MDAELQINGGEGRASEMRVRILHLEDSSDDAELVRVALRRGGLSCAITLVTGREAFESALQHQEFDIILCDHRIPGYEGFAALDFARQRFPEIPVIILTGALDDAEAVQSLKRGATDYVLKGRQARLVPAIHRALREAVEHRKQLAAERRIREQANLLNLTLDAIIVRAMNDQIVYWNAGATAIFGWAAEDAIGQEFAHFLQCDPTLLQQARQCLLQTGDWLGELKTQRRDGQERIVLSHWNLMRDEQGRPEGIITTNTDVTERKKIESVLLRAQRMDGIGALANGIAHDLSNSLAPILMCTENLNDLPDDSIRRKFNVIHSNAERASNLVKHILGFVRGQHARIRPVDLTELVREMEKMARLTFPKSITIRVQLPKADPWVIQGDPTELHQILLNLCVNARDAMPDGGELTLSVQHVTLDAATAAHLHGRPGPSVLVSVADTGSGIPEEIRARIFEPFFTTKPPESGTGIGLSTVAAIAQHHGGCIELKTETGKGTEFRIYFPAVVAPQIEDISVPSTALPTGHGELILVIEDEEAVLELIKETLENYGYQVVAAHNAMQGLAEFEKAPTEIKMVVTDSDMTQMSGLDAVRNIREIRPDLPVIVASGSIHDEAALRQIELGRMTKLDKPYTLSELLVAVARQIQG